VTFLGAQKTKKEKKNGPLSAIAQEPTVIDLAARADSVAANSAAAGCAAKIEHVEESRGKRGDRGRDRRSH
jgi:hypothetical protein